MRGYLRLSPANNQAQAAGVGLIPGKEGRAEKKEKGSLCEGRQRKRRQTTQRSVCRRKQAAARPALPSQREDALLPTRVRQEPAAVGRSKDTLPIARRSARPAA